MSPEPRFRTSTYCASNGCVEVAYQQSSFCSGGNCVEAGHHDGTVLVRDGKDPDGTVLDFPVDFWNSFLDHIADGNLTFEDTHV